MIKQSLGLFQAWIFSGSTHVNPSPDSPFIPKEAESVTKEPVRPCLYQGWEMPWPCLISMAPKLVNHVTFKRSWPDIVTGGSITAIVLSTLKLQGKEDGRGCLVGRNFHLLRPWAPVWVSLLHPNDNSYFLSQQIHCRPIH